jgi:hypothetical protein
MHRSLQRKLYCLRRIVHLAALGTLRTARGLFVLPSVPAARGRAGWMAWARVVLDAGRILVTSVPAPSSPGSEILKVAAPPPCSPADDDGAYRPATRFLDSRRFPTYKRLHKALKKNPWIRTRKPSPQRLEVHAGDWDRYLALLDAAGFDALDMGAENVDAFLAEVRRRLPDAGRRKART